MRRRPQSGQWPYSAVVVFSNATDFPLLRWLKPGFRHCFVAVSDGRHWVTVDPLAQQTLVAVQPVPARFDIAGYYEGLGMTAVALPLSAAPRRLAPLMPFTCVEAVKRILGIHDRRILTPWQLYRHVTKKFLDNTE